ncbi:zinc ribbon domain-containing protein [Halobaculum roseum]|uniref:Zinc ribbon domain-containing protein n=1 Tax=Halobaculum roseum TaxID=2175149 RepID=A0ABD5MFK8_9EURY|nr:zinc ribbon domain-containing protein [Halobaculum roseum]QZY02308.1 zinc ribbon domain-containing protein [Halobaculum roseum]
MNLPRLGGSTGRKRPWLAVLLALAVTGLGHAYLRRWLRAFGWFAATFAAVLLFVPPEVVEALNAGDPVSNPVKALPPVIVVLASAVDAYMLARATREDAGVRPSGSDAGDAGSGAADASHPGVAGSGAGAAGRGATTAAEAPACPNCGKDLDADLDFCPWCTTRLEWDDPEGPDVAGDDDDDGPNP